MSLRRALCGWLWPHDMAYDLSYPEPGHQGFNCAHCLYRCLRCGQLSFHERHWEWKRARNFWIYHLTGWLALENGSWIKFNRRQKSRYRGNEEESHE